MSNIRIGFKQKTINGIEYNSKFKSLNNCANFNNYFDFLKLFFSSNPDIVTPELLSPLYDVIIEFAEKCDQFVSSNHYDFFHNTTNPAFENIESINLIEQNIDIDRSNSLNMIDMSENCIYLRKKMLKYIYSKFSTFLNSCFEQNAKFDNLKIFLNIGTIEQPKYDLCKYECFEKKILNLMFLLVECTDIKNKTLMETFPQIPKICIENKFPDFECIDKIINCLNNQSAD
jgi:hypothetical protein